MVTYLERRRRQKLKRLAFLIVALLLVLVFYLRFSVDSRLSSQVRKNLDFSVMLPPTDLKPLGYSLNKSSLKTFKSGEDNILSYELVKDGAKITITEQSYPEVLIYDKLANGIKPYSEIKSVNGTVTLGRPQGPEGRQVAVSNPRDLLIFAYPTTDLTDKQWKEIFDSLEVVK